MKLPDFKAGPARAGGASPIIAPIAADPRAKTKPKRTPAEEVEAIPAQLTELQAKFKSDAKNEEDRFADATDSEYWVAICFRSREHKERWLELTGLADLGDKYLDGHEVAARQKLDIGPVKDFKKAKHNRRLEKLT